MIVVETGPRRLRGPHTKATLRCWHRFTLDGLARGHPGGFIARSGLIGAFFVQFAALVFLLWETGGPIDSPFAELTLAIAVFTPFLANDPKTVLFVVLVTIVYYAVLTLVFSETHDGSSVSTSPWAYFAVNVTILLGAIIFTMIESVARRVQSGMADLVDPPDEQEHGIDPTVPAET